MVYRRLFPTAVTAVVVVTSIVSTTMITPAMAATVAAATTPDGTYVRNSAARVSAAAAAATTTSAATSIATNNGNEVATQDGTNKLSDHAILSSSSASDHHQEAIEIQQQLDGGWHRKLPELSTIWHIPDPVWNYTSYDSTTCELRYEINDLIEDAQVQYTAYERDCLTPIPNIDAGYTIKNVAPDEPVGTGSGTREFKMHLVTPNSQLVLQANPNVFDNETLTFNICIRMSLHTPSSQFSYEANFVETKIKLTYDLNPKGFTVNTVDVIKPEFILDDVDVGLTMKAYDCTQYGDEVLTQGSVVMVCIEPVAAAIADGFRMNYVEEFKFVRPETNYTQWAVQNKTGVEPFSKLTCVQGSTQCVIEIFLLAGFYTGTGVVDAVGTATMQLGTYNGGRRDLESQEEELMNLRRRRWENEDEDQDRSLQAAGTMHEISVQLPVTGSDVEAEGGIYSLGPDGNYQIDDEELQDFIDGSSILKKFEYLLNNDAAVTDAMATDESVRITDSRARPATSAETSSNATASSSYIATIWILVLMGLNFLALIMLAFQASPCKKSKLYL